MPVSAGLPASGTVIHAVCRCEPVTAIAHSDPQSFTR
jgi:hypothetical protein